MVRGLALKTLANLARGDLAMYVIPPIQNGFSDRSAYVRRAAVVSCAKLHAASPSVLVEYGLIEQLYSLIRDADPVVASDCLGVLETVLAAEGGVVVSRSMAHYLLNRLATFSDWNLTLILSLLHRHRPRTEEEALDIMNLADPYLKHRNAALVLTALQYFVHLVKGMPHLKGEVYSRGRHQITHFINTGGAELVYMLLNFVESLLDEQKDAFQSNYKSFFCRYNEPLYLKQKKVSLLPRFVMADNVEEIVDELAMHCADISDALCQESIRALAKIATAETSWYEKCVRKLLDLVQLQIDHVTSNVVQVFQTMNIHEHGLLPEVTALFPHYIEQVNDTKGRSAILWLLGEYGALVEDSPYYLEDLTLTLEEEGVDDLGLPLLTATTKLFLCRPAECQEMLGAMFEKCLESKDRKLRDKATFYYKLLQQNPKTARQIISGE